MPTLRKAALILGGPVILGIIVLTRFMGDNAEPEPAPTTPPAISSSSTSNAANASEPDERPEPAAQVGCAAVKDGGHSCKGSCGFQSITVAGTPLYKLTNKEGSSIDLTAMANLGGVATFHTKDLTAVSISNDLVLFGQSGHTCTLNCDADGESFTIDCSNPRGGSCSDTCGQN